ncbi:hypothetical protein [Demequina mangrovi]|uniref:Uncharacterized protein n=1 Tax=Demequina mangrovi TaxID=1043493 RepID=A0A1H7AE58_9MICO|nr:hypothetical protein [Demequina mangrovi]SEJ63226.1 hypothetical protein SAMN05421637_2488 [Demequina mangrovi]
MTADRSTFENLQALAVAAWDDAAHGVDVEAVAGRVARHRRRRGLAVGAASVAVVALGFVAASLWLPGRPTEVAPATSSTPAPAEPTETATASSLDLALAAACNDATEISGKAIGNIGGLETDWNSTPGAPCDEWPIEILEHPNTVVVNTSDGTMLQADYRVDGPDMDPYRDLGPAFLIPDPDPTWPADKLVVIDAATREVLEVNDIPDHADTFGLEGEIPTSLSDETAAVLEALSHGDTLAQHLDGWELVGTSEMTEAWGSVLTLAPTDVYDAMEADPSAGMTVHANVVLTPEPLTAGQTVTSAEGEEVPLGDNPLLDLLYYFPEQFRGGGFQCPIGDEAFLVVQSYPGDDPRLDDLQVDVFEALRAMTGYELPRCVNRE